jgi:hypothetical protein
MIPRPDQELLSEKYSIVLPYLDLDLGDRDHCSFFGSNILAKLFSIYTGKLIGIKNNIYAKLATSI